MAALSEINAGDRSWYDARTDSTYINLACSFHSGCEIVGSRPGVDEETQSVIEIPVFSTEVGFQPDCPGCRNQATLTLEHVNAVEAHDAVAEQLHGFSARYGERAAHERSRS